MVLFLKKMDARIDLGHDAQREIRAEC